MFIGIGIAALGVLIGGGHYGLMPWITVLGLFVFMGSIIFLWNAAHCPKCKAFIDYSFHRYIGWKSEKIKHCSHCGVSFEMEMKH